MLCVHHAASILYKLYMKRHKLSICLIPGRHIFGKNNVLACKFVGTLRSKILEIENEGAKFA